MEASYQEEVSTLHEILKKGVEELCKHAKQSNFLEFPFGRKPDPTPLISEEFFINAAGGPDCDDKEPPFVYDYGFDPLKFLSDYMVWAHPRSVAARQTAKVDAQARLTFRANHALNQLDTQQRLVERIGQMRAGIQWGPFGHAVSGSKLIVTLQPLKPSTIYVQTAEDRDFTAIVHTVRVTSSGSLLTQVEVPRLEPSCPYFIRCFAISFEEAEAPSKSNTPVMLSEFDEEYQSISDRWRNAFACVSWTLPADGDEVPPFGEDDGPLDAQVMMNFLGQFPSSFFSSESRAAGAVENGRDPREPGDALLAPLYTFLLGDLLAHGEYHDDINQYLAQISTFFQRMMSRFWELRRSSLLLAWRDSNPQSGQALRLEEVEFKQYRHEMKKYNKRYGLEEPGKGKPKAKNNAPKPNVHIPPPPQLKRPAITTQQLAIMHGFPMINYSADGAPPAPIASPTKGKVTMAPAETAPPASCRMLYHTKHLSAEVQVIVLDVRRTVGKQSSFGSDYLGREQAEWLQHVLRVSAATWKIIVCGKCFGLSAYEDTILTSVIDSQASVDNVVGGVQAEAKGSEAEGEDDAKPAQLTADQEATTRTAASSSSNLYDEVDEVYGRSKYSLQHILAEYQKKQGDAAVLPAVGDLAPMETLSPDDGVDHYNLFVTSGILLMTSGVTSFIARTFQPNSSNSTINTARTADGMPAANNASTSSTGSLSRPGTSGSRKEAPVAQQYNLLYSSIEETSAPCYVAAYQTLNGGSIAPTSVSIGSDTSLVCFCSELSLGTNLEEQKPMSNKWKNSAGMTADTFFFNHLSDADNAEHVVSCEMQVLGNGSLFAELFAVNLAASGVEVNGSEKRKLACISLAMAVPAGSDHDDRSQASSVHMV